MQKAADMLEAQGAEIERLQTIIERTQRMSAKAMLTPTDWPGLEEAIMAGEVPTFATKKAAVDAGAEFSFRHALRLERRFERVWLCAKLDLQPDLEGSLVFDVLRVPLLKWETNQGVKHGLVAKFRRLRPKKGNTTHRLCTQVVA